MTGSLTEVIQPKAVCNRIRHIRFGQSYGQVVVLYLGRLHRRLIDHVADANDAKDQRRVKPEPHRQVVHDRAADLERIVKVVTVNIRLVQVIYYQAAF